MAAILKSNMAAPDVNSDIAKMFPDIENIGIDTRMLVLGAIEQEIMGKSKVTRAREFLGSIFYDL